MEKEPKKTDDDKIIEEALENWRISDEMLSDERTLMLDDIKFSIGDSENHNQWESSIVGVRRAEARPMYTINKLPQFINQVVNDARANVPSCKIRPVDSGADKDSAEIYNGLCRNIENVSQADIAYDTALEHAARCGIGYFRLRTDYLDYLSFNQDLVIERIADPLSVRLDPFYTKFDAGDMRWAFIESTLSKKQFESMYPKVDADAWEGAESSWYSDEGVRIVEYFKLVEIDKTLQLLSDGSTNYEGDELPENVTVLKSRMGKKCQVEWYKLTAAKVLESSIIKCSQIPIYPVIGNETYVEGKPIRSGLIRNAKDPQRIYNMQVSLEIELGALAPKAPYIGYAGQFKDPKWESANIKNHPYLEAEPIDINGSQAPLPQRQSFAGVPAGVVAAKQAANQDIRESIGIYNASLGANSPETSGRAILAKQKEGDTGTFHYVDNLGRGKARCWRNMIEMIPAYYDVARVARILGEDGSTSEINVAPDNPQALSKVRDRNNKIKRIFNPNIGRYDVVVTVGASYATQRMEAAESQLELAKVIPQITQVAPDLMTRSFDFKGADEIADRLKSILPQGIAQDEDGEKMPPQVQQAIQQVQQTTQMLEQHQQQLSEAAQALQQKEAQIAQEAEKLEADKALFDAQAKLTMAQIETKQIKAEQAIADTALEQVTEEKDAYVVQLEQMVTDLSQAVEDTHNEEQQEIKTNESALLAESVAKLAEIAQNLASPHPVKKVGTAIKDPITGQMTLSVIEVPIENMGNE